MKLRYIVDMYIDDENTGEQLDLADDIKNFIQSHEYGCFAYNVSIKLQDEYCIEHDQKKPKKEIPKKVVFGYDDQDPITCPDCKIELAYMDGYGFESNYYKYCPNCGRKLNWER